MAILPNKKIDIINDPVYGFISIPYEIISKIIEHPYFQRLRRITQLGLTHMVYPGAKHTRFQHAIGATHLMQQAINTLRSKGQIITEEEAKAVSIAILLHDIGHGPYSHTLEHSIVEGVNHEDISDLFMDKLNDEFNGELNLAISIFRNQYHKKFLYQLVSSQLDMDRLDYLIRDSFFTGVSEGVVSTDRIIKMLTVVDDQLAIEAKGIYSIEKFIIARRLMYWQVYLHKTVTSAEFLLIKIFHRARQLASQGHQLFATPVLHNFLTNSFKKEDFLAQPTLLEDFAKLDDYDIMTSVKIWISNKDFILSKLCEKLVNRNLLKIELQNSPFSLDKINNIRKSVAEKYSITPDETNYFVFTDTITNSAYNPKKDKINIRFKDGSVVDIAKAADLLNISVLSEAVKKHFLCYPKKI